jgi:two-component system NtrC family sensor kinase
MSIRFKLTTIAIAVILVVNSFLSFVTVEYLGHIWLREIQTRVQRNLSSARAAYQNRVELIATFLQGTVLGGSLQAALERTDQPQIQAILRGLQGFGMTDFVLLVSPSGKVIYRGRDVRVGDDLSSDALVRRVIAERRAVGGTIIVPRRRLEVEGNDLAGRACFELVASPTARPTGDRVRSNGMVIAAAVPLVDAQGRLLAILYGGSVLARRYQIVDAIQQQVFPQEFYQGKEIGAVTIFQGDLRIATNITLQGGARAVGTRLSAAVAEEVLDRGGTWAKPAFAVNDWYITAYEPIRDPAGRIIGVLSMGVLQAPFFHQLNVVIAVFLTLVVAATLANLVLLFLANELVLLPIRRVAVMAQKVIGGDLSARVGIRPPGEMGLLCRAVDSMAQAVAERQEMLQQATRQEIGRSEHLASVGRLAAGVAHEINNPLTGVLAFADMLRQKENMDEQDKQDLDLIVRETKRAREIVRGLLDFARETPSVKKNLNVNDVLRETLRLLGNREAFQNIYLVDALAADLPLVNGDKNQLQQVFLNLSLNACEAMPGGGTLMLSTSSAGDKVLVEVTDTGCGIKREQWDQIFQPFFTTKPVGKGTGLGLSVSYGIVQQHDGTLEVKSEVGKGSTFTITLPAVKA